MFHDHQARILFWYLLSYADQAMYVSKTRQLPDGECGGDSFCEGDRGRIGVGQDASVCVVLSDMHDMHPGLKSFNLRSTSL